MAACFAHRAAVVAAQSSRVTVHRAPFSSVTLTQQKALRLVALRAADVQEAVVEESDELVDIDASMRSQQREEDAEEKKFKAEFQERTVQVRRVTKVVKGGKQLSFRAVVIVGYMKGRVGVGCAAAKEVVAAVRKASVDARKNLITVPLTKDMSFPHKIVGDFGAASVMLRPASDGTGVIAGGSVRVVMELAGVKNGFGKQLGSKSPLNNAQATIEGFRNMRTWHQVAAERDISLEYLFGKTFVRETEALAA